MLVFVNKKFKGCLMSQVGINVQPAYSFRDYFCKTRLASIHQPNTESHTELESWSYSPHWLPRSFTPQTS